MKPSVFVHSWVPDDTLAQLKADFDVEHVDVFATGVLAPPDFARRLAGKAGLLVLGARVDEAVLMANAGTLKVVANCAVGVDNIDVPAATRNGVLVTNTPGVLTEAVADMSMALLLAVARRVVEADRFTRAGKFAGLSFPLFWGAEMSGETVGVVGMGRIGQALARRARGFGLKVVYCNRRPLDPSIERETGAEWLPLEDLLRRARYVVLLTPLTPETRHLIDAERLALMRPDSYLINISRGPVVHEAALLAALRDRRIAGAALDVFEFEPQLTLGLTELDSVVLTPHIGSATVETRHAMVRLAARNLTAALKGETVPNPVNKPV